MMVLCNFGIFCTIILAKLLQSIFFGKLRLAEIERINDRLWFTISETLLALAMFRDEFDTSFVVLFISLIFVKCFHWLAALRVEWMDQSATPPGRLFHARMISILSIIWVTDMLLIAYATESVLLNGPSVLLMFEMEYIIMQVTCLSIICKYMLNSYAHYRAQEHWEAKSTYQFYIDLATDFLKLLTYIGFLSLTLTFNGLPINVLRDVYYTFRSFISKCNNLVRFRQATRNMNERYPNATREEMEQLTDKTCIICREDMEFREEHEEQHDAAAGTQNNRTNNVGGAAGPNDTPKKLSCSHIFHFHCLRSWLERQQTCPTCRRPVIQPQAAPPVAPPNPQAAANRAFAAAMAAAGAPPLAQAPQPIGRAAAPAAPLGFPAAPPAPQQQPGGAEGTTSARAEFHHRLREFQQRMAAASNPHGAPNNSALPGPSSQPLQNPLRPSSGVLISGSNPLSAFDLSDLTGSRSSRPNSDSTTRINHSRPLTPIAPPGFSKSHTFSATSLNRKNPLASDQLESSHRQVATLQPTQSVQPLNASHVPEPEVHNSKEEPAGTSSACSHSTTQVDARNENPLQHFGSSGATQQRPHQAPAVDAMLSSLSSQELEQTLTNGQTGLFKNRNSDASRSSKVDQEAIVQLPCLIPLFDVGRNSAHSSSASSLIFPISTSNNQLLLNRYKQKLEENLKLKTNTEDRQIDDHNSMIDNREQLNPSSIQQLIDIQNSLIDCCSKLSNLLDFDPQVAQVLRGTQVTKGTDARQSTDTQDAVDDNQENRHKRPDSERPGDIKGKGRSGD